MSNFLCKLVIAKELILKTRQQNCYGNKNRENKWAIQTFECQNLNEWWFISFFCKFGFGHLLSRLSLEKQDGVSASELILLFVFFRIVVESIICDNDKEMSKALVMTEVFNPNQLLEHNVLKFLFLCCFLTYFIFLSSSCLSL